MADAIIGFSYLKNLMTRKSRESEGGFNEAFM